jgi:hypothetical protein
MRMEGSLGLIATCRGECRIFTGKPEYSGRLSGRSRTSRKHVRLRGEHARASRSPLEHTVSYLHLSQRHLQAAAPIRLMRCRSPGPTPSAERAGCASGDRATFEVADIIRQYATRFIETHHAWLTAQHRRVIRAIAHCRTAAFGAHLDR